MYDLVLVSVAPQASGPPGRAIVDPIRFDGLEWGTELNRDGFITCSTVPETVPTSIADRLRDLKTYPSELWVFRDGVLVQAGPVVGWRITGENPTLALFARGMLYYTRYMTVTADSTFSGVDQYTIGKTLIDDYQALSYGDFGLDTTGIGTSGTTRDRTYLAAENHEVYQRLVELADVENGFDVSVTLDGSNLTAALVFEAAKGSDLSGSIIFDRRNISDGTVDVSVAAGDLASDAQVSGEAGLTSTDADAAVRAAAGRRTVAGSFDGVSVQSTLDGKAAALLASRDRPLLRAAISAFRIDTLEPDSFDVGDTVGYSYDPGIGLLTSTPRVVKKTVTVDQDGAETIAPEFA